MKYHEFQNVDNKIQGPNIAESFLPKTLAILGIFGDIFTFGDMGTEKNFLFKNKKTRRRSK
jgi:hypothetical protein